MDQISKDVTDAELAVLQVLWDRGESTIRQLADVLYPGGADTGYATVQKLLERLEDKEHVARDRSGHAHLFRAVTDRDTLVGHRLRAMAEKLCGGLMGPLLTHLVRAETLSKQERQQLRTLIDELDRKKAKP
jgi:predicted transcriptional regulator